MPSSICGRTHAFHTLVGTQTSLIQRFVDNNVRDSTASTIGVDFVNKVVTPVFRAITTLYFCTYDGAGFTMQRIEVDSELIILQIWDTAGHERSVANSLNTTQPSARLSIGIC
jgi:GTPase SAR1 family protein